MSKVRRKYWGKEIYRLWVEYLLQMDYQNDPLKSLYSDWNLDSIKVSNDERILDDLSGRISTESFERWWKHHWRDLFGESDFAGDVLEIKDADELSDDRYLYVKIEIPPNRKDWTGKGKQTKEFNKTISDKVKILLNDRSNELARDDSKFTIADGKPNLQALRENLEIMYWRKKKGDKWHIIARNVSFLSNNLLDESKRKRIVRGFHNMDEIKKNIGEGFFP